MGSRSHGGRLRRNEGDARLAAGSRWLQWCGRTRSTGRRSRRNSTHQRRCTCSHNKVHGAAAGARSQRSRSRQFSRSRVAAAALPPRRAHPAIWSSRARWISRRSIRIADTATPARSSSPPSTTAFWSSARKTRRPWSPDSPRPSRRTPGTPSSPSPCSRTRSSPTVRRWRPRTSSGVSSVSRISRGAPRTCSPG